MTGTRCLIPGHTWERVQVIRRVKREDGNYTHISLPAHFHPFVSPADKTLRLELAAESRGRLQHRDAASSRATLKCFSRYFNQLKRQHVSDATVTFASLRLMHTVSFDCPQRSCKPRAWD